MKELGGLATNLLLAILVALGGWNLLCSHSLAVQMADLNRIVLDGKKLREDYMFTTNERLKGLENSVQDLNFKFARIEEKMNHVNHN